MATNLERMDGMNTGGLGDTLENLGANGRVAIINPAIISTVPISIEAACTLITLNIQDISGELAIKP